MNYTCPTSVVCGRRRLTALNGGGAAAAARGADAGANEAAARLLAVAAGTTVSGNLEITISIPPLAPEQVAAINGGGSSGSGSGGGSSGSGSSGSGSSGSGGSDGGSSGSDATVVDVAAIITAQSSIAEQTRDTLVSAVANFRAPSASTTGTVSSLTSALIDVAVVLTPPEVLADVYGLSAVASNTELLKDRARVAIALQGGSAIVPSEAVAYAVQPNTAPVVTRSTGSSGSSKVGPVVGGVVGGVGGCLLLLAAAGAVRRKARKDAAEKAAGRRRGGASGLRPVGAEPGLPTEGSAPGALSRRSPSQFQLRHPLEGTATAAAAAAASSRNIVVNPAASSRAMDVHARAGSQGRFVAASTRAVPFNPGHIHLAMAGASGSALVSSQQKLVSTRNMLPAGTGGSPVVYQQLPGGSVRRIAVASPVPTGPAVAAMGQGRVGMSPVGVSTGSVTGSYASYSASMRGLPVAGSARALPVTTQGSPSSRRLPTATGGPSLRGLPIAGSPRDEDPSSY